MNDCEPSEFASPEAFRHGRLLAAPLRWPRPSRLDEPLRTSRPGAAKALESLGLRTVGDLLEHLPRDRREARTVAALSAGEAATVVVRVRSIRSRPVRRRGMRPLVEATVADDSGPMKVTFFNQPWLESRYRPGTRLVLHGRYEGRNRFVVSHHAPTDQAASGADGEVGHYAATEGISSTEILALVRAARPSLEHLLEPLPAGMRLAEWLPDRRAAVAAVHYGERPSDAEAGRRRLAFDELLLTQLLFLRRRRLRAAGALAQTLDGPRTLTARWLERGLPFELTGDQQVAVAEIERDLAEERPMQRLLLGEVGAGKTVCAVFAMLRAVEHGMQAALMAPTETLAEQHFATLQRLLGDESVTAGLLTGATPARRRSDILGKLASGELALVVGTHALIERDVRFDRLAVGVVDEQHRFGVRQRAALDAKAPPGLAPHVLHMTATPIPRTLALLNYGDLDQTILRELPSGRQPVATHIASGARERARAYERIREELRQGRQAFVVCPLVEESEQLQARAATVEYERLAQTEFRDFSVVLLHGQMRPRSKQEAMASFAAGGADVLVATSVIEVGIDVPNATVMLVENAERYGISQLHQLRGRVGRGPDASVCVMFGPRDAPRLRALAEHQDGFVLAQLDLELRKEGELIGTRQSGLSAFGVARLPDDQDLLERARAQAEAITASDPELEAPEHALLADQLERRYGADQLEPIPA
ncbi:MAG TPA: ATP-dependent DNA helicase RecG [Solirubrobacteraceae bacterium]|nr:ATP-dependent DNA helicase RecG [Solirubrobacteraceae bacterium]